jgi:acyl-CoA hydrolase
MEYKTRQLVKPDDLNASNSLFGGRLLSWIDEEAAIYAMCALEHQNIVTAHMSSVTFESRASQGDIIEIGTETVRIGRTSMTIKCHARNISSHKSILTIDEMVFVCLDEEGNSTPHGKS